MQHLALNNMQLAWDYCLAAFEMSSGAINQGLDVDPVQRFSNTKDQIGGDPLVLNELGVILYHQGNLPASTKLFRQALTLAGELGCNPTAWVATRANLGHALRRLGRVEEALMEFDECLRTSSGGSAPNSIALSEHAHSLSFPGSSSAGFMGLGPSGTGPNGAASGYDDHNLLGSIYTSRGLVLMGIPGRIQEAVASLHEAVRVLGGDAAGGGVAGTLLGRAMEIWGLEGDDDEEDGEGEEEGWGEMDVDDDGGILIANRKRDRELTHGKKVEMGLDGDAEEMLGAAMGVIR
jgi:anaphase-promoting complex subunit 6